MIEVDSLPFCYRSNITVDVPRLIQDVNSLLSRLNLTEQTIIEWFDRRKDKVSYPINLTHLPRLNSTVSQALGYRDGHAELERMGINEAAFTEFISLMDGLYLGEVVKKVYTSHDGKFQGRTQLAWLGPNRQFPFHTDTHTPNRYHIPLITNPYCYWLFRDNSETYKLHMPADGSVWYLDPTVEHTFVNDSDSMRLHILFTSGF